MHLQGRGCRECGLLKTASSRKLTTNEFILRSMNVHGDVYTYEKTAYIFSREKVTVTCKLHGDFCIQAAAHLSGKGCTKCGIISRNKERTKSIGEAREEFSKRGYELISTEYVNSRTNLIYLCDKHGEQTMSLSNLKSGYGCPLCAPVSKGERAIWEHLSNIGVTFKKEQSFKDLTSKRGRRLRFDFSITLPDKMLLIEFHGQQHYRPQGTFVEGFDTRVYHDKLKENWARENNIPLLIIPYSKMRVINKLINAFIEENMEK